MKHQVCREVFRTDARAEGEDIFIGGWAVADSEATEGCRWFSEKLTRFNASWAFLAGEPFRAIASLELLATLAAVVCFGLSQSAGSPLSGSVVCSASTDNLGNACVMKRLLTTRFPLMAFVMELAALLLRDSAELRLDWCPRLQNREADALTNEDFRGFAAERRVRFCFDDYEGIVLQDMLENGAELFEDIRLARAKKETREKRARRAEPLKNRDPWQ